MFEKFSLASQLELWITRGWKLSYSGLPDPTVEFVVFRRPDDATRILDHEILMARRSETQGVADCRGRIQLKWGTQVRAGADPSPLHSAQRGLKELFGWEAGSDKFELASFVGPWVHRSTAKLEGDELIIDVFEEQGEMTPFVGPLFAFDAKGMELGETGAYLKAMASTRWVRLEDLVNELGDNSAALYWHMVAICAQTFAGGKTSVIHYYGPGQYRFILE